MQHPIVRQPSLDQCQRLAGVEVGEFPGERLAEGHGLRAFIAKPVQPGSAANGCVEANVWVRRDRDECRS